LFYAYTGVYEDVALLGLYQQAAHGPGTEVVGIWWVLTGPKGFGHYAEHSAAV
jgi:hypothetical protein